MLAPKSLFPLKDTIFPSVVWYCKKECSQFLHNPSLIECPPLEADVVKPQMVSASVNVLGTKVI